MGGTEKKDNEAPSFRGEGTGKQERRERQREREGSIAERRRGTGKARGPGICWATSQGPEGGQRQLEAPIEEGAQWRRATEAKLKELRTSLDILDRTDRTDKTDSRIQRRSMGMRIIENYCERVCETPGFGHGLIDCLESTVCARNHRVRT